LASILGLLLLVEMEPLDERVTKKKVFEAREVGQTPLARFTRGRAQAFNLCRAERREDQVKLTGSHALRLQDGDRGFLGAFPPNPPDSLRSGAYALNFSRAGED
jgi:hypothetical protein